MTITSALDSVFHHIFSSNAVIPLNPSFIFKSNMTWRRVCAAFRPWTRFLRRWYGFLQSWQPLGGQKSEYVWVHQTDFRRNDGECYCWDIRKHCNWLSILWISNDYVIICSSVQIIEQDSKIFWANSNKCKITRSFLLIAARSSWELVKLTRDCGQMYTKTWNGQSLRGF